MNCGRLFSTTCFSFRGKTGFLLSMVVACATMQSLSDPTLQIMRWEPQTHLPLLEPYLIQDHLAKLALMQRASGAEMPLFQSTLKVTVSDFQGRGLTTTLLVPFPFAGNKHCLAGRLDCVINIIGHMLQYLSTKKRLLYCMKWHNYFMYRLYTICESWTPLSNVFIRRTTWLCAKESMSAHVQQSVVYIY